MNSATKETLQYRQALYQAYQSLDKRPLSIATVCDICTTIRQIHTAVRKLPGTTLMNDLSRTSQKKIMLGCQIFLKSRYLKENAIVSSSN